MLKFKAHALSAKIMVAIVARTSSPERPAQLLKNRALTVVGGETSLAHIVRRLSFCPSLNQVVLALGDGQDDEAIRLEGEKLGLEPVCGFPDNILKRLCLAAKAYGADEVVRINGNFPLIDPWALNTL
ncbi:MAG: hypothetical protein ACRCTY_00370, partial [Candidatus Adiutrix sp.]